MSMSTRLIITGSYFAVGGVWILFSHTLLILLSPKAVIIPQYSEAAHWIFLGLSSAALYLLLHFWSRVQLRSQASLTKLQRALERFLDYSKAIAQADNVEIIMEEVCRICVEVGGYRMACIVSAELDEEKSLTPIARWGHTGSFLDNFQATWKRGTEQGNCPIGRSIYTGRPVVFQNLMSNPDYRHCRAVAKECGFGSCLSIPLKEDRRISGALIIFHAKPDAFDADEVTLLETLANDLSYGMTNLRIQTDYQRGIKEQLMLAAITRQTSDGVFTFSPDGIVQYVNPSFVRLCGSPLNEIMGASVHEIDCSRRNPEFYQAILGAIRTNSLRTGRFINRDRNGQEHDIDGRIAPVFDKEGHVVRYVVTVRDVSEEVRLQRELRQAQKLEVLSSLSDAVIVDLQKQLTTIRTRSTAGLVDKSISAAAQQEFLEIVRATAKSENLLEQFKAASQRCDKPTSRIDVSELVSNSIAAVRSEIPSTVEVVTRIDHGLGLVAANTNQFRQVVKGLCENGVEAMSAAGGVMEIGLAKVEFHDRSSCRFPGCQPGKYAKLTITDTGHGMGRDELERVFDPFYTTKGAGRGMGLAVAQRVIKNHAGHISINSIAGTGTSVTVLLPLVEP